jgi:pimeloyl-ACP methyl ester carboxylesterase
MRPRSKEPFMPFDTDYEVRSKTRSSRLRWAGLAGRQHGDAASAERSFVFLHGLTFDRHMWDTVLDALPPDYHAIAFDLPGHGASASLPRHSLAMVVDEINDAVLEAEIESPVIVGHSIGAAIASMYAVKHDVAAVVNVDSPTRVEVFARLMQSLAPRLMGDEFAQTWSTFFRDSMHIERVPLRAQGLLRAGDHVSQSLVLSYWADLLELTVDELVAMVEEQLFRLGSSDIPYLALYGNPIDAAERIWLNARLPQAEVVVWPVGHHFPHLAQPAGFASLIVDFASELMFR